jgi:hypothetical protein
MAVESLDLLELPLLLSLDEPVFDWSLTFPVSTSLSRDSRHWFKVDGVDA